MEEGPGQERDAAKRRWARLRWGATTVMFAGELKGRVCEQMGCTDRSTHMNAHTVLRRGVSLCVSIVPGSICYTCSKEELQPYIVGDVEQRLRLKVG